MRITREEKERRKEELLEAGVQLIMKQGYGGTGVSEITSQVGMPKGSFFNYFSSKEEYIQQAVLRYVENSMKYSEKMLGNENLSPLKRIEKFYDGNILWFKDKRKYQQGCLLNGLSQEVSDYNDNIALTVKSALTELLGQLASCLEAAQKAGEISNEHDPMELAVFLDNSWRGILTIGKSMKDDSAITAFKKYIFQYVLK